jgi:hypothetical protein
MMSFYLRGLLTVLIFIAASPALAQDPPPPALDITRVWCVDPSGTPRADAECELGDAVVISVSNLAGWIDKEAGKEPENLILVLNGQRLTGRNGALFREDADSDQTGWKTVESQIGFILKRKAGDQENREAWRQLMARSTLFEPREMELRIGLVDSTGSYQAGRISLLVASPQILWGVASLFVLLLGFFLWMAAKSDIIRNPGERPKTGRKMYSLARSQMAWWFFIVAGSFLYIWMVTGEVQTLTAGVLGLIGISAATGFSAAMLDTAKKTDVAAKRAMLVSEQAALETRVNELGNMISAGTPADKLGGWKDEVVESKARIAEINKALPALPEIKIRTSEDFLSDILQDDRGITFHRFQIFAWTIVLGGVFIRSVYIDLSMPEFDATLLGLLGISSGTYIGFKFPAGATK